MKRLSEQELSIKCIAPATETQSPHSEIWLEEKPKGQKITGATLEAAAQVDNRYLLFVTDDIPFEEILRIYLLDTNLAIIDYATLGAPYATGAFKSFEIAAPDTVRFSFIGDCKWSVRILNNRQFHLPFVSDPRGISRRLKFSTYLKIHGNPLTEKT